MNAASLHRSDFRNNAPNTPETNPSNKNHGNCDNSVKSKSGTRYHGVIPKKLRDNTDATTDANTSGPNKCIEKFPSTTCAANTAPPIGALYAAPIPAAAPHATSSRSRYGCHPASCPQPDASVAVICVIEPSRPIDAPVPKLSSDENDFTNPTRNGSRPSPAITTSSRFVENRSPNFCNPRCNTSPAASAPSVGAAIRCHPGKCSAISIKSPLDPSTRFFTDSSAR